MRRVRRALRTVTLASTTPRAAAMGASSTPPRFFPPRLLRVPAVPCPTMSPMMTTWAHPLTMTEMGVRMTGSEDLDGDLISSINQCQVTVNQCQVNPCTIMVRILMPAWIVDDSGVVPPRLGLAPSTPGSDPDASSSGRSRLRRGSHPSDADSEGASQGPPLVGTSDPSDADSERSPMVHEANRSSTELRPAGVHSSDGDSERSREQAPSHSAIQTQHARLSTRRRRLHTMHRKEHGTQKPVNGKPPLQSMAPMWNLCRRTSFWESSIMKWIARNTGSKPV